jgi:hypothetical protein
MGVGAGASAIPRIAARTVSRWDTGDYKDAIAVTNSAMLAMRAAGIVIPSFARLAVLAEFRT